MKHRVYNNDEIPGKKH